MSCSPARMFEPYLLPITFAAFLNPGCNVFGSSVVIAYFSLGHSAYEFGNAANLNAAVELPWPYSYGCCIQGVTILVD